MLRRWLELRARVFRPALAVYGSDAVRNLPPGVVERARCPVRGARQGPRQRPRPGLARCAPEAEEARVKFDPGVAPAVVALPAANKNTAPVVAGVTEAGFGSAVFSPELFPDATSIGVVGSTLSQSVAITITDVPPDTAPVVIVIDVSGVDGWNL